jgi:Tfp pilus assembly protein PilN
MGGLSTLPQVNLYRGRSRGPALPPGARLLLFAGVALFVGVLLLAAAGEVYLAGVRAQQAEAAARLQTARQQLEAARSRLAPRAPDPFLQAEQARLQVALAQVRTTRRLLKAHEAGAGGGFAGIFAGLARNTVDGLWLRRIDLQAGGVGLSLSGSATEPALVPRLLQRLAHEPLFEGRSFREVEFTRVDPAGRVIDFELRSALAGEVADAR